MVIKKAWDTGRQLCPLVFANFEKRKNTYHGQSPVTWLIPNQRYVNKMFAIVMLIQLMHANPKLLIDKTKIASMTNKIGGIIETNGDISNAAKYLEVAASKSDITAVIEQVIRLTKEMSGANDTLLGNTNPEQASGRSIVAVQKQAMVPIEMPKQNVKQMWEDLANVLVDTMITYYGERDIVVELEGKDTVKTVDFSALREYNIKLKIDVGASSIYDEMANQETLDNLLANQHIDFVEWLKRANDHIPLKDELLQARQGASVDDMQAYIQQMPQQEQQLIMQLPPEWRVELLEGLIKNQE